MNKSIKILFVFKLFGAGIDGVSDYLRHLMQAFKEKGVQTEILTGREPGFLEKVKNSGARVFNLHYVPQAYTRFGLAPGLTFNLCVIRFSFRQKVIVTLHEVYEPLYLHRPFRWPAAVLQRGQLFLFLLIADQLIFSTPVFLPRIGRLFPFWKYKIHCLPVFSNVTDVEFREEELLDFRRRWGIARDTWVLGAFSKTLHEALSLEMLFNISRDLAAHGISTRVFLIGAMKDSNPDYFRKLEALAGQLGIRPVWTGPLSPRELSAALQLVNVYMNLAPDGVSPRSTAFMAALNHGLPVMTGKSPQMHPYSGFKESVLMLESLDANRAADALVRLKQNPQEVEELKKKARLFYDHEFGPGKTADGILGLA